MSEFPSREQVEQWIYARGSLRSERADEAKLYLGWHREKTIPIITQIVRERGYWTIDAIEALVYLNVKSAAPTLMETLRETSCDEIPASAAWALGELRISEAVPILIEYANATIEDNRAAAIQALGKIGEARAVPTLEKFLNDRTFLNRREQETYWLFRRYRNWRVSDIAFRALEKTGTIEALEALTKYQESA